MFLDSRFAKFGPTGLVDDVLCIPGEVVIKGDQLQMVALRESHPYAAEMALCLAKLQEFWDRLIFGRNFGVPYFGIARISPKTWVSVNQD